MDRFFIYKARFSHELYLVILIVIKALSIDEVPIGIGRYGTLSLTSISCCCCCFFKFFRNKKKYFIILTKTIINKNEKNTIQIQNILSIKNY
jgi:hypothetical protein